MSVESVTGNDGLVVEKVKLKRSIGFWDVSAILVTNIGGSACFISPPAVLQYAGSPIVALIIWLISGILNAGLAFCFIEVALFLPKAGGPYFYILEVFGSFCGFIFLWGFIILICAPAWSVSSYSAVVYIVSAFNPDCAYPDVAIKILAAWLIVTLMVLNCTYMKFVTKVQGVLTGAKILALFIIIIAGFTQLNKENYLSRITEVETIDAGSIALGLFSGFFNYGGWPVVTILVEEVQNPTKTLPRAVILSMTTCTVLYVLVNFSYCVLLSPTEMIRSEAVAVLAMQHIHPALGFTVSILVALCSLGVLNVLIMGQPRILFAASRVGHVPDLFRMISCKYLTPWPAIIGISIPVFFVLLSGNVVIFIDTLSLFASLMVSTVIICLLYLRYSCPDVKRPLKLPIVLPITMLLITVLLLVMSIYRKPRELGTCLLFLIMGSPLYVFGVLWKNKPKQFIILKDIVYARDVIQLKRVVKTNHQDHMTFNGQHLQDVLCYCIIALRGCYLYLKFNIHYHRSKLMDTIILLKEQAVPIPIVEE